MSRSTSIPPADDLTPLLSHTSAAADRRRAAAIAAQLPDEFHAAFAHKLEQALDGILVAEIGAWCHVADARFLFKHAWFIEQHLQALLAQFEGQLCSGEKARSVLRALARHFATGEQISSIPQAFGPHLPARILRRHDDVLAMFRALQMLYTGRPVDYLKALSALHAQHGNIPAPRTA